MRCSRCLYQSDPIYISVLTCSGFLCRLRGKCASELEYVLSTKRFGRSAGDELPLVSAKIFRMLGFEHDVVDGFG